ncbi:MAG: aminotransferase class I/II-fold pyridoxal phosphate-dependent enzyme [Xanthomonadales bacterium]|jgi:aspartate/methionine/tyrosine aminotransferase|nr:aminotransferase class I/II-fold pyridoxal phosphate-dependent enzyme [Xanthomonadales bacterium]
MDLISKRTSRIATENAFRVGPYIAALEEAGNKVIKCNLGEPDFPLPTHIRDEVKRQLDLDNVHYTNPQGVPSLRKAVAKYIGEARGLEYSPEQVVVFPGGKPPIGLCQQTYTNPGDEIIYPSPGFPIYESFIRYVGAVPVPLHLREEIGFSFTGADLEKLITPRTKLIFMNFPSNPTGGVASKEQLEEIADVIKRKCDPNVRIYSDEIYENILFDGARNYSIASVEGMQDKVLIATGASKSYSWTGGRIGWVVFPNVEEAKLFTNLNINYFSCIPPYNQEGARLAIEAPESKVSIATMNEAFQRRRDFVVDALNAMPGVSCQSPKGAFYVFPNIAGVVKDLGIDKAFARLPAEIQATTSPSTLFQMFLLWNYCVATMDRKSFGQIGTENMHFLRLSIATGLEDLKIGMQRMAEAINDKEGFARFMEAGEHFS